MTIQRHFLAWLDVIDVEVRRTISEYGAWLGVTVLAAVVIAVAGIVPVTQPFFGLPASRAALSYLPIFAIGMSLGFLQKRGLSLTGFGMLALLGIACFQFFMWSLVGLSRLPGATVMASLPILLACYHGYVLHSGPRTPYVAVCIAVGGLLAAAVHSSPDTLPIFAVGVPVAVGCALILGRNSQAYQLERRRNAALREAVDAQLLTERARHVEVLTQALGRLQGTSHDAGNALSGVLFNLEQLVVEARRQPLSAESCTRIGDMARDLSEGLNRLRDLMLQSRELERKSLPQLEVVNLTQGMERVVANVGPRFPHIRLHRMVDLADDAALGSVSGGDTTLDRVLTNIVTNACEGNGSTTPSSVRLQLTGDISGLRIVIEDDGPGFPPSLLDAPFRELATTKANGIGLGLYVSERLMRVSGGSLRLSNRGTGGARVELALQRFEPT